MTDAAPAAPLDPNAAPASPLGREAEPAPQDQQQQPPAPSSVPDWMGDWPDELKTDKSLEPFYGKSPADIARSYIETKKMVGDRVIRPTEGDADSIAKFVAALRPETADDYKIELPEGMDDGFANHMRPAFYDAGLQPWQVEKLVAANNSYLAQTQEAMDTAGQQELADLKTEMGAAEFERGMAAARSLFGKLGIPVDFDTGGAKLLGTANFVRYAFALAERAGEMGKINDVDLGLTLGTLTPEAAQRELDAIVQSKDPDVLAQSRDPNSEISKKIDQLSAIIASARQGA